MQLHLGCIGYVICVTHLGPVSRIYRGLINCFLMLQLYLRRRQYQTVKQKNGSEGNFIKSTANAGVIQAFKQVKTIQMVALNKD